MAIYLIDYENVYIDGMDGLELLTENDEVVIFYTQKRCGLTFDLHRRLISCKASLKLMEVLSANSHKITVKNALDLQLTMYIGYLLGRNHNLNLYIISRDTDFNLDIAFFEEYLKESSSILEIHSSIKNAYNRIDDCNESGQLSESECFLPIEIPPSATIFPLTLTERVSELLGNSIGDPFITQVCTAIEASENLLDLNNLLVKFFKDTQLAKETYHKIKPCFAALKNELQG